MHAGHFWFAKHKVRLIYPRTTVRLLGTFCKPEPFSHQPQLFCLDIQNLMHNKLCKRALDVMVAHTAASFIMFRVDSLLLPSSWS